MAEINNIVIIGCSVALRIRPPEKNRAKNKTYVKLLSQKLNNLNNKFFIFTNLAFSRALVKEVYDKREEIVRCNPDFIIINIGAVDAPTREIPLWFSDIIFKRNKKILFPVFNFIYLNIIKRYLRRSLVKLRFYRTWGSVRKFKSTFESLIQYLIKETSSTILVLDINKGNEYIENNLPRSLNNYKIYSKILKEISINNNLSFIDFSHLDSECFFPDGVHYNYEGHKEVSECIYNEIIKNGQLH